jgi:hypothetical protein
MYLKPGDWLADEDCERSRKCRELTTDRILTSFTKMPERQSIWDGIGYKKNYIFWSCSKPTFYLAELWIRSSRTVDEILQNCRWDIYPNCGWDLAELWMRSCRIINEILQNCGWDLAEPWMRSLRNFERDLLLKSSRMWMRSMPNG